MKILLLIFLSSVSMAALSQRVIYPQKAYGEKVRNIRYFQIVGRVGGHFLVYENQKSQNFLRVYDDSMNLKSNIKLTFHPEKFLYAKFFDYPDFAWMIYVYRRRNIDYFMAAKINGNGELVGEPKVMETSHVGVGSTQFINVLTSKDKSKILVYKDHRQLGRIDFTNLVFNSDLQLIHRSENVTYYNQYEEIFDNFSVSNEGDWIFTREKYPNLQSFPRAEIQNAQLYTQYHNEDTFRTSNVPMENVSLQALSLNIDNLNKHVILNSLYSSNSNVDGLYTAIWNESDTSWASSKATPLGKTIRSLANPKQLNKAALDNFYIQHIFIKKDGGFIVAAEQRTSIYSTPNPDIPYRSSSFALYDTYQNDRRQFLGSSETHLNTHVSGAQYGNILVLDADSSGNLQWGNVVPKNQYGDVDLGWISYATVYRGGQA